MILNKIIFITLVLANFQIDAMEQIEQRNYLLELPHDILDQIFIKILEIDKTHKATLNIFSINKEFQKKLFESLWLNFQKKITGKNTQELDLIIKLNYAIDIDAWCWLDEFIKNNKNLLKENNIFLEKLLVREIEKNRSLHLGSDGPASIMIVDTLLKNGACTNIYFYRYSNLEAFANAYVRRGRRGNAKKLVFMSLLKKYKCKHHPIYYPDIIYKDSCDNPRIIRNKIGLTRDKENKYIKILEKSCIYGLAPFAIYFALAAIYK